MRLVAAWFSKITVGCLVLGGLVVVATGILIGVIAHAPTPFHDQWENVAPEQLSDIFRAHNEHRVVLTRIIQLADLTVARGTGVVNVTFVYLFSFAHLATLLILAKWAWPNAGPMRLIGAGAVAASFFFSGFQYENFSNGFQNQFVGVFLFATAAIATLCIGAAKEDGSRPTYIGLSMIFAILGVCCMANGLLIAPLLAIVAAVLGLRATSALMAVLAVGSWVVYFIDFHPPGDRDTLAILASDPIGFILNVMAYAGGQMSGSIAVLGGFFSQSAPLAQVFGAIAILFAIVLVVVALIAPRRDRPRLIAWASIAIFVVASGVVTAVGRNHLGESAMLASRYGAGVAALWSAIWIFLIMSARPWALPAKLAIAGAAVLLLTVAQLQWLGGGQSYRHRKLDAEAALLVDADVPEAYEGVFPGDAHRPPPIARLLRSRSLAMFYEPWRRLYGKAMLSSDVVCSSRNIKLVSHPQTKEGTLQLDVTGQMPADTRAIAVTDSTFMVVGLLIRGGTDDINSDLFGANDAPPLWQGYARSSSNALDLTLNAVNTSGIPICRLDRII